MDMLYFRQFRQTALFLTLRAKQNIPRQCLHSAKSAKRCLLQSTMVPKNNGTIVHHQSYPFRLTKCGLHTSPRREVNPLLWLFVKPIAKISAALTGRGVRKWYRGMEPKERKKIIAALKRKWYLIAGAFGAVVSFFVVYYISHIEETPITGRKRFVALTYDQILSIANVQGESLIETYKDKMFPSDSLQVRRVMDVAQRILLANPELQKMNFDNWKVYVINDPTVNAFVLPTGQVFVFEGMLNLAQNQDELALILGHEMSHTLLEHGIEELSYVQFMDYIVILVMAALWCVIPNDGIALVTQWFHNKMVHILAHLPHSRELETEADLVGAMLASKACYDVRHGMVLWQKMEAVQKMETEEIDLPTFLSTHPHNLERADFFDFIIPKTEKWRVEGQCPLLPINDPRKAIQVISKLADEYVAAKNTGQNLRQVQKDNIRGIKTAAPVDLPISKVMDAKEQSTTVCIQKDE